MSSTNDSEKLPLDCINIIFRFLTNKERYIVSCVSKKWFWSEVARYEDKWELQYEEALESSRIIENPKFMEIVNKENLFYRKFITLKNKELENWKSHFIRENYRKPVEIRKDDEGRDIVKFIVIGDHSSGFLKTIQDDGFPSEEVPCFTVLDNFEKIVEYKGNKYALDCWDSDTGGRYGYERLRPLSYPETNVFILVYQVTCSLSIHHVEIKWVEEIIDHCPSVPYFLCGLKTDLRNDEEMIKRFREGNQKFVTFEEGYEIAREIGASAYFEVSSKEDFGGVKECLQIAVAVSLGDYERKERKKKKKKKKKKKGKGGCCVM